MSEAPEVSGDALERGLKLALDSLDQTAVDVPFAPALVRCAQPVFGADQPSTRSYISSTSTYFASANTLA